MIFLKTYNGGDMVQYEQRKEADWTVMALFMLRCCG